jgi:5'-nucleotidase (lipoprotein e(P4) family)
MKERWMALIFTLLCAPSLLAQVALPSCPAPACSPRPADATRGLEIKYVRDSAEYATLCRQVYRMATEAVRKSHPTSGTWGVILDVDETTLDNSQYQLERGIYGLSYDDASWANWVNRAEAGTVPGVKEFLDSVRALRGRIVFITDRYTEYVAVDGGKLDLLKATRENLERNHLLQSGDLLCLKTNANDGKPARRKSAKEGSGVCSWNGMPVQFIAFVGDQMTDFPQPGESFTGAGTDKEFGTAFFLLPQPMYGRWTNGVTRESGAFKQVP